ncbi:tRNA uracil 4-sulfurtransferase ThiI [Spirochaeta thermophila]|uniref:Probable tRNA sulfurtransferase n=1 Tax=Winmispira thermophila (strain ATCC 49972 / DSM 6192 / RI 19.B1) TaxID=665571 RepID=E0RN59_WINT6|nr:tRNA uracil 4-sulfurtransferase ThiI [Spirochaeta thermophila]ADN02528.1 probable thiamine biosynthesis protein ThiI [Spirochaeta thermophila DSM 6192]
MRKVFIVMCGELTLKGENKGFFEETLKRNILQRIGGDVQIEHKHQRFYIACSPEQESRVREALGSTFGIVKYAPALELPKEMEAIKEAALLLAREAVETTGTTVFKIEAKRTDKSFPLTSYDIAKELGALLLEHDPRLSVRMTRPDWSIKVEIRDKAYLFWEEVPGPGGLPVGSSGTGMLLLSGGIDSPVAGYLMAKRGLALHAAYFHTYPYTSDDARKKVETLAAILSRWTGRVDLHVVPFTEAQIHINRHARKNEITLHMRAAMVRIATILAGRVGASCLITGESLGQVASQTAESMRFTQHTTDLPVFRPLVGMDKQEIIALARRIGTFETSILPYADCCTLFSPEHPLIRPHFEPMRAAYQALELEPHLEEAAERSEHLVFTQGEPEKT